MRHKNQNQNISIDIAIRFRAKSYKLRLAGFALLAVLALGKLALIWYLKGA